MKLSAKKRIVGQPERSIEIEILTINRINDYPVKEKVVVIINELSKELVLWEDESYDKTCSWTLETVETRIEELLNPPEKEGK